MPVYPGSEPPQLTQEAIIERDGFAEKRLTFSSHTGTHVDAPAHMLLEGKSLSDLPINTFIGSALILDVAGRQEIKAQSILPCVNELAEVDFVLLKTGWEHRWGQPSYFEHFPVLTPEAAELMGTLGLQGVGVDAISVDRIEETTYPVHNLLFNANMILIENLRNLDALPEEKFTFMALPMPIFEGDGAPARVIAIL